MICEDLAKYGVVLLPPSSAEYFELLADIKRRLRTRPKGTWPLEENALSRISERDGRSFILLNRAPEAVVSLAYIWHFSGGNGHTLSHIRLPGTSPSVLLPFGLEERFKKIVTFWNTIFPGSKRVMMADGSMLGDNTDVRPANADELWHGGFITGSGGDFDSGEPLKLTLDGVFFTNGGFAGPNRLGVWEQTVFAAEAYLACAALARETRQNSRPARDFFTRVQQLTGQSDEGRLPPRPPTSFGSGPSDPEPIRKHEIQMVGFTVMEWRKLRGDEATVAAVAAWADAPVPKFHKL